MLEKKSRTFHFDSDGTSPGFLNKTNTLTETIDLDNLFPQNVSETGSFLVRGVEATSLGRLLNALPIPALLVNESYSIAFANEAASKTSERGSSLQGLALRVVFGNPQHAEKAEALARAVFISKKSSMMEALLQCDGKRTWSRISMRSLRVGNERYVIVLAEDLTLEKKQMLLQQQHEKNLKRAYGELEKRVEERTAELLKINEQLRQEIAERERAQSRLVLSAKIIESSNEAIVCFNVHGQITMVNQAFCSISGYSRRDAVGKRMAIFQWGRPYGDSHHKIWSALISSGQWQGEAWDRRADGEPYPILLSIGAVKNAHGKVTHYVAIFTDITKIKQVHKNLRRLAHYDHLTKLPNRLLFHDRLQQAIVLAQRQEKMVAIMLLDLDRFKNINDTLGHRFGDRVLIAVAERLKNRLRMSDTAARLGGDEFMVVIPGITDVNGASKVARNIIQDYSKPFSIDGREIFLSASIGITVYPNDGHSVDLLLQNADTALHYAKEQGKNRFQFFSQEMNDQAKKRQKLEHRLHVALSEGEFELHYQPMVDVNSARIIGIEALLRWRHPVRGPISAAKLIPLAEETGLIVPVGEWVLRTACEQNKRWQQLGLPPIRVAVNLSGRQLRQRNIIENIMQVLREVDLAPEYLEIELTETVMMDDAKETVKLLDRLKDEGVRISIDDFGTGYSSLSYLKKFPVDKLKIDRSFVKNIALNSYDQALVKAIVTVAHSGNLTVIAEGVENREQLTFLRSHECDEVQGYLLGRPLSSEQTTQLLRKGLGQD